MIQPGDFIFYPVLPSSNWLSKLIGWGERVIGQAPSARGYSHVAVAGPDVSHQYEAWFPKIRNTPVRLAGAEIYRIRNITSDQVRAMMQYAQAHVGEFYDVVSILTLGLVQIGGTDVCSQFAYKVALAAGVVLGPPESFQSPDDDEVSKFLVRVG